MTLNFALTKMLGKTSALNLTCLWLIFEAILVKFPVAESLNPLTMGIHISIVFCFFRNTLFLCLEMLKVNLEPLQRNKERMYASNLSPNQKIRLITTLHQ